MAPGDPGARRRTAGAALAAACLIAGCGGERADGPARSAPPPPWFEEVARERGLDFVHDSGHEDGRFLLPEVVAGGAALFDMDGDGDLDAYLVQGGSLAVVPGHESGNALYENVGGGRFRAVSDAGDAGDRGYGMGVACGDYDDDGDVDLYVTNVGANTLLRNEGGGRFRDVTATAGVGHDGVGASAVFLDYDVDGDLDLFVANYVRWSPEREQQCRNPLGGGDYCAPTSYDDPAVDVLYRNDGEGRFTDVTASAGVDIGYGNGLGVLAEDFDDDGRLDIFVANDGMLDQLWVNRGDGTFDDQGLLRGCAVDMEAGAPKAGMGVTAADVDDDGAVDLLVTNLRDESDSAFRNEGGIFTDMTARLGLRTISRRFTRFGVGWVDFDNDGRLDLYEAAGRVAWSSERFADDVYAEPNLLFRGEPGPRFEEVLPRGGTAEPLYAASRAAAFGDVDDDGGMDVVVVNRDAPAYLLRNVVPDRGRWAAFRVRDGVRDAEGARLEVRVGDRVLHRSVRVGYSYLACNDPRVHVGLGDAERVDGVRVRWVDGAIDEFGPFDAGRTHELVRRRR